MYKLASKYTTHIAHKHTFVRRILKIKRITLGQITKVTQINKTQNSLKIRSEFERVFLSVLKIVKFHNP